MRRVLLALVACIALAGSALAQTAPRDPENLLYLDLDYGRVTILLRPDIAPKHVARVKELVRQRFYDGLKDRGYVIYPGKLTVADSFRVGCIGRLTAEHMRGVLATVREILAEMKVRQLAPAQVA